MTREEVVAEAERLGLEKPRAVFFKKRTGEVLVQLLCGSGEARKVVAAWDRKAADDHVKAVIAGAAAV